MRILAVGDTHFPFIHWPALAKVIRAAKTLQPDAIVQVGDLYDLYSYTSHPKSHDVVKPSKELSEGRKGAALMWARLQEAAPKADCYQMFGNHDMRLRKRIMRTSPEVEAVVNYLDVEKLWKFDGVTLHGKDDRHPLVLGSTVFIHGYTHFGGHVRKFLKNTVTGHLHRGGVEYVRLWGKTIWELNCGFLADFNSRPFAYPPVAMPNWTHGYGLVTDNQCQFIHI